MSIVSLFRGYIEERHPHLARKDWRVDVRTLSTNDIESKVGRATIPAGTEPELTYWVFFYDNDASNMVYVLQDKQDPKNIGIGLLVNGVLVEPISIYEGAAGWHRSQLNMITSRRGSL